VILRSLPATLTKQVNTNNMYIETATIERAIKISNGAINAI